MNINNIDQVFQQANFSSTTVEQVESTAAEDTPANGWPASVACSVTCQGRCAGE